MQMSREDRVKMERAHVFAWPALNTAVIDGWLWRCSGGGSQRANSVSTIDFTGADPEAAIAQVELRYHALGEAARFHTFDETSPPGLADILRKRGYQPTEPTTTMFKRIEAAEPAPTEVEARDHAWSEWRAVYLNEITENRRAVNTLILDRIPGLSCFFGCRRSNEMVATALCVVSFGCAVIECVATRSDARRRGAAQSVLAALERWAGQQSADLLGLQVATGNAPAVALYQRLGFVAGATNSFWVGGSQDRR
ncbi:MAG: N-acetyltransferase [Rhodopila sp.]|jgi:ribosomal protein S18 acetylase RimI-like enzyme|nr:N-acetyltransferase [Rhodopila sp.]